MKKPFLFLILSIVCLASVAPSPAEEENLINNPGFENGLSNWENMYWNQGQISSTVKRSGNYSLSKDIQIGHSWTQTSQEIQFNENNPVYAKVYVKTTFSSDSRGTAGLMLQFMNSSDNIISEELKGNEIGGNTGDWRIVEINYKSAPSGTTKIRVSLYTYIDEGDDSGEAYFDDVSLIKQYNQPSLGTTLSNPGFENGLDGWKDEGVPSIVLSSDIKNKGSYAAQKTISRVGGEDFWREIYQTISCSPNKRVTAKLYIKTAFSSTAKARGGVMIQCLDSNDSLLTKTYAHTKKNAWIQMACKILKTPKNTAKIKFIGYIYAPAGDYASNGGKAYFDDASIEIK